jgi:cytochrome o ubiquinol oxidase subunit 3
MSHQSISLKNIFGFWVYLMTDCMLFATLFATYVVLSPNVHTGPSGKDLFDLPFALTETLILLASSFACTPLMMAAEKSDKKRALFWFVITFLLGVAFLVLEISEFSRFVHEGNSWQRSAFLSGFFALVATHGCHITVGLLWMAVLVGQVITRGFTPAILTRLTCFKLFWHFLDVVWIFIFTIVYLMGSR